MVKIVFMGPAGSGKTSIRRVFFKGEDAKDVLENPSEPTYWEEEKFEHIDFFFRVVDLGGQEGYADEWHGKLEQMVFGSTDALVFVVDASDRKAIVKARDYLRRVISSALKYSDPRNLKVYVLLHKVDLLREEEQRRLVTSYLRSELTNVVKSADVAERGTSASAMLRGVYETSICDGSANTTMRVVFNDVMPAYDKYKQILSKVVMEEKETIEAIQLIAQGSGLIVAEAIQPDSNAKTRPTGAMANGSTRHIGAGIMGGLTSLVANLEETAGGINGSAIDYSVLRLKSGRFALIKDLSKRYYVVAVSRKGTSEHVFLTKMETLLMMMKDLNILLQS